MTCGPEACFRLSKVLRAQLLSQVSSGIPAHGIPPWFISGE